MKTEAAVVGAGPAGLLAAKKIAENSFQVKVFEEHKEVGEPNHCAGIISAKGLQRLGLEPLPEFVQMKIKGARLYSPSGECIEIIEDNFRALAVDRTNLDRYLAFRAMDAGVEIIKGTRVTRLCKSEETFVGLQVKDYEVEADIIVNAEGVSSRLLKKAGLPSLKSKPLVGVNVQVTGVELEPGIVEVWFSQKFAPGLFAWVIPISDNVARCGLASKEPDAHNKLTVFLSNRFDSIEKGQISMGLVHTGRQIDRSYWSGLLVTGDVAGQTKATTGGGVITGGLCSLEAGKVVAKALESEDTSFNFLSKYESSWKKILGDEFRSMQAARKILNKISDSRMDHLFRVFKEEDLSSTLISLVEKGDMDMQSNFIKTSLKNPQIIRVLLRGLGRMAIEELLSIF